MDLSIQMYISVRVHNVSTSYNRVSPDGKFDFSTIEFLFLESSLN